jgi:uncharacterized protein (DUF1778 family)
MPAPSPGRTARLELRLTPGELSVVDAIAEVKGGLTRTRVLLNALELYGKQVLGRRLADLAPVDDRAGRRGMPR